MSASGVERARTEWLRHLGFDHQNLARNHRIVFVVTQAVADFLKPARLDDLIDVTARVTATGRASLTLAQQAWRGTDLLTEGSIRIGCVDATTFRPRRIPDSILDTLK